MKEQLKTDVLNLQVENMDLDKRMTLLEKKFDVWAECYDCSSRNVVIKDKELTCLNCGGVFVNSEKGVIKNGRSN